jgi:hypothetical protein
MAECVEDDEDESETSSCSRPESSELVTPSSWQCVRPGQRVAISATSGYSRRCEPETTEASGRTCGGAQSLVKSLQLLVGVQPPQLHVHPLREVKNNVKKNIVVP